LSAWADRLVALILTLLAGSALTFEHPIASVLHWPLDSCDRRNHLTLIAR
jgi:hypothetical protein